MLILSIDSSDIYCRVGIGDFSTTPKIKSKSENLPYKQAENLLPMIENFMHETKIDKKNLNAIAVACGPGSFSGIRIAIATARAIALVLNIPVLGYDNFSLWHDSILENHQIEKTASLLIILQSKRSDLYAVAYQNKKISLPPQTAYPEDLIKFIKTQNKIYLSGNMNEEFLKLLPENEAQKITSLPQQDFDFNRLAINAKHDISNNNIPKAEPVYLRLPQTSVAKKIWTQHDTQ